MQAAKRNQEGPASDGLFNEVVNKTRGRIRTLAIYIVALGAFLLAFARLRTPIQEALDISDRWIVLMVVVLPIACTFIFEVFPAWRRHRRNQRLIERGIHGRLIDPGYFRLDPYEDNKRDQQKYIRADGSHEIVLEWLYNTKEPILYLTARSGSGKTSMLDAFVLPKLRQSSPPLHSLVIRSFLDPIESLRKALLETNLVWKHPPAVTNDIHQLIEKACNRLRPGRLLLVFDQFEELLIIHNRVPSRLEGIKSLLASVAEKPISGLNILIVVRSDYIGLLQNQGLSIMRQNQNWKEIHPFSEQDSRDFIARSELQIGPTLMDTIIKQAEEIEETRGLIRPITLNFIGMILSDIYHTSSLRTQNLNEVSSLLMNYLRESIRLYEIRDTASFILRLMLTQAGTKHPKSAAELSEKSGFDTNAVTGCLLNLSTRGIVRRIDEQNNVWEISHDFVARLLSQILIGWRKTVLEKLRPWIVPGSLIGWAMILLLIVPVYLDNQVNKAKDAINQSDGIIFRRDDGGIAIEFSEKAHPRPVLPILRKVPNIVWLDLSGYQITDADLSHLAELKTLKELLLLGNEITDVGLQHLAGLKNLQQLDLRGNKITDVGLQHLAGLKNLQSLYLWAETNSDFRGNTITDVGLQHLAGLKNLQYLDLRGKKITGVGLQHLAGLENLLNLDLSSNEITDVGLQHLAGLENLPKLDLRGNKITDVGLQHLAGLKNLQWLDLSSNEITDVGLQHLAGLENLEYLSLRGNRITIAGLKQLAGLKKLSPPIL